MFTIKVTGSTHRRDMPSYEAENLDRAIVCGILSLCDIAENDPLHFDEAKRALEFWRPEEIRGDLQSTRQCDMLLCGGYYCVEIREVQ